MRPEYDASREYEHDLSPSVIGVCSNRCIALHSIDTVRG
jgi:hypothetical protein